MNLKTILESLIAQAMEDEQELIATDKLPAALILAGCFKELQDALQELYDYAQNEQGRSSYDGDYKEDYVMMYKADALLAKMKGFV